MSRSVRSREAIFRTFNVLFDDLQERMGHAELAELPRLHLTTLERTATAAMDAITSAIEAMEKFLNQYDDFTSRPPPRPSRAPGGRVLSFRPSKRRR